MRTSHWLLLLVCCLFIFQGYSFWQTSQTKQKISQLEQDIRTLEGNDNILNQQIASAQKIELENIDKDSELEVSEEVEAFEDIEVVTKPSNPAVMRKRTASAEYVELLSLITAESPSLVISFKENYDAFKIKQSAVWENKEEKDFSSLKAYDKEEIIVNDYVEAVLTLLDKVAPESYKLLKAQQSSYAERLIARKEEAQKSLSTE